MRPEPSFARSVVAWGNACLRGQIAPDQLDAWLERARPVRALSFSDAAHVAGVTAWLAASGARGATRLMLEARVPVGGDLAIVVVCETPESAWRQRWTRIAGATAPPWFDADFSREPAPETLPPAGRTADEVLQGLLCALEGLVSLGARADLAQWGDYFEQVIAVARDAVAPDDSTLPPSAPATAHRLARAANLADVFGGMGSWNDFVPLPDRAAENERLRLSSLLHEAVAAALLATAHA